jgi:FKBP-type peptidyl-prolyl cis-trans isomerase FkpA
MKFNFLAVLSLLVLIVSCTPKETKTKSGYAYEVLAEGSGDVAKTNDYVMFTIKISGDDGKLLQEMGEGPNMPVIQIPAEFPTGKEANPVVEVLAVSKVGSHIKLFMPIDSMPQAPVDVQAMKHIVYEIMVKEIKNEEQYKEYMAAQQAELQSKMAVNMERLPAIEELVKNTLADYNSGSLETKTTESGLKYYILNGGEGANAAVGNTVSVQYYGTLLDGTMFDNSFKRGQSFPFTLGVGQGWDEGIALLNKGSKAFLFIPYALAYGEAGSPPSIPAKSDLVFYVELEDITGQQ